MWNCYEDDSAKGGYEMILGRDILIGPVVSKHGNLGPVGRARGAGSPTDRTINAICLLGLGTRDPRAWHRKGEGGMEGVHDTG